MKELLEPVEEELCEEEELTPLPPKPSTYISSEIKRLKAATIASLEKRERLPQPLFWSLFHSELKAIRRAKKEERIMQKVLDNLG